MDGGSFGSNVPGHPPDHARIPAGRSEGGPDPGSLSRPRKFVIQSTFGVPRERRSRKSRPCDACRRRKTACIITTEPPCTFCKSRGITCQSTISTDGPVSRQYSHPDHGTSHHGGGGPSQAQHASINSGPLAERELNGSLGSPTTTKSSPPVVTSPSAASDYSPRFGSDANTSSAGYPSFGFAGDMGNCENDACITGMDIVQPALNSPESSVTSAAHTLEDNPGRATYFLGGTAEQDPFVLDAFSYGILSESSTVDANVVQLHRGGSDVDDLPQHFLFLSMGHPKHTNLSREEASDAMETKVWPHADVLVRLYFRHVHPVLPILSKVRFLRRYSSNRKSLPACLRGAVYALACVFWNEDPAARNADPFPFHQHEIVDQAHRALRRELENPNLFVVQAFLLLIHVQPPSIDAMEAPSTFTLAAQATACAQLIGLHQDSSDWNLEFVEKKLRKKLWWAVFITDCWAAISLGNPPHISESSFNTVVVDIDDLRCDEEVPEDLRYLVDLPNAYFDVSSGARFLELVKITRHLRGVLDYARSQLILCGNFLVYLFLMAAERQHIEAAHKMLEDFRLKVNRMSLTDHVPTKALLRATTIRTNSFFAQAASVMRHGPEASIREPITVCGTDGPLGGAS
ncbi:hypothetical protein UVI_02014120 [Ustilaginoidea virens]|uniref:Zn(2)-C6 fungal-type domain-containing protein n=1 Tax=Ustilaginoidea virens TaxID=1159556 RepID=A0A1B5KRK5_USTVR|nr:hypothetical protein UVI_02014120 [Ustilaginoidea virens]